MTYPQLRTPHGLLVAVHNGTTLAYLARLHRLAAAARTVADEWCLFDTSEDFLRLTPAEREFRDALDALGEVPQ